MEKHRRLLFFLALIACSIFVFFIFSTNYESEASIQKKEQALGAVINDLKNGDVYYVSYVTHPYLFDRLEDKSISSSAHGKIKLGTLSYDVSKTDNGYVLTPNFEQTGNQYYLILEQTFAPSYKIEQYAEILLSIKKQEGAYAGS